MNKVFSGGPTFVSSTVHIFWSRLTRPVGFCFPSMNLGWGSKTTNRYYVCIENSTVISFQGNGVVYVPQPTIVIIVYIDALNW